MNLKRLGKTNTPEDQARSERKKILQFWSSLNYAARKKIVRVEKQELLKKIKEKHKHICSCTVCGRKRAVIDREVERLYDQYCTELEYNTTKVNKTESTLHNINTNTQPSEPPQPIQQQQFSNDDVPPLEHTNEEDFEDIEEEEDFRDVDDNLEGLMQYNFGRNLYVDQGAITITEDWLRQNSADIIDILYRFVQSDSGEGLEMMMMGTSSAQTKHQHRRPLKRDEEDEQDENVTYDDEEEEEEEDEEEDEEDEEDEEEEEEEEEERHTHNEVEDNKWRESKKMFRMYAAKLFYEKIVMAYREKLALEMQNILIQEEEEKDRLRKSKEKKARETKIKKQKKDEEREKKKKEKEKEEADKKREEAEKQRLLREAQREELDRKRMEEERTKIEAQMIEMVRKNLERQQQQEKERLEEFERQKLASQMNGDDSSKKVKKAKKQKREEKKKIQPSPPQHVLTPKKPEPVIKQVYLDTRPENITEDIIPKPLFKHMKSQPVMVKAEESVNSTLNHVSPRKNHQQPQQPLYQSVQQPQQVLHQPMTQPMQQPPQQNGSFMWGTFHPLLPASDERRTSLDSDMLHMQAPKQVHPVSQHNGSMGMYAFNQTPMGYPLPMDDNHYPPMNTQQMWPNKPPVGYGFGNFTQQISTQPHIPTQQYNFTPIDNEWSNTQTMSQNKNTWGDSHLSLGDHDAVIRPQNQQQQVINWGFGQPQNSQRHGNEFQLFGSQNVNWLG
jgi:hypothetical protein